MLVNLFLNTCLGASSWELAWERFPPIFSHHKNKTSNQISQDQVRKPGCQERFSSRVPKNRFPGKGSRNSCQARFPGTGSLPGTGFQEGAGSQSRVPRTETQVPKQGFQEQVSLQGSKVTSKVLGNRFPSKVSTNRSPSKVPKDRFASKLRKNRFPSKGSKNRFPRTGSGSKSKFSRKVPSNVLPARFHEHVPKHGFRLLMFPGTALQEQLAKRNFEEHLQARLEARTESQARFRRTGS